MLNVQSTCQILRLNLTIFTVIGFHSFHVTSELPACGQEIHSTAVYHWDFVQELTIFHSRLFNISALTLSDLGSKMLDSCCSVGCSNRRGDKPGFCFYCIQNPPTLLPAGCRRLLCQFFSDTQLSRHTFHAAN